MLCMNILKLINSVSILLQLSVQSRISWALLPIYHSVIVIYGSGIRFTVFVFLLLCSWERNVHDFLSFARISPGRSVTYIEDSTLRKGTRTVVHFPRACFSPFYLRRFDTKYVWLSSGVVMHSASFKKKKKKKKKKEKRRGEIEEGAGVPGGTGGRKKVHHGVCLKK